MHCRRPYPDDLRQFLRECLRKDPRQRWRDLGDARLRLDALRERSFAAPRDAHAGGASRSRRVWPVVAAIVPLSLALGFWAASGRERPAATPASSVYRSPLRGGSTPLRPSVVVSPDGSRVAFIASDATNTDRLWIRRLDAADAQPLVGTESADLPFWSPDSANIGFFADGHLKRVPAAGGPVQGLADAPVSPGGTWNAADVILFANAGHLSRVPAAGGMPSVILNHSALWPHFLPDGHHFLYFVPSTSVDERGVYVGSIDGADTRLLLKTRL